MTFREGVRRLEKDTQTRHEELSQRAPTLHRIAPQSGLRSDDPPAPHHIKDRKCITKLRSRGRLREMRAFRIAYAFLALNFAIPTLSYAFTPAMAMQMLDRINHILGGGALPPEQSVFWWVLGVANVGTLAFCCGLLWWNLKRWQAVLVPLLFLKGFDAVNWAAAFFSHRQPVYGAAALLDFFTVAALWWFPTRALRELNKT